MVFFSTIAYISKIIYTYRNLLPFFFQVFIACRVDTFPLLLPALSLPRYLLSKRRTRCVLLAHGIPPVAAGTEQQVFGLPPNFIIIFVLEGGGIEFSYRKMIFERTHLHHLFWDIVKKHSFK